MRAVCIQAVHEKFKKMGGPRKKIEVSYSKNILKVLKVYPVKIDKVYILGRSYKSRNNFSRW